MYYEEGNLDTGFMGAVPEEKTALSSGWSK